MKLKYILLLLILIASGNRTLCVRDRLTEHDIMRIYNDFVNVNMTDEYCRRYVPLPLEKNNLPYKWEGKDFPRIIALLEFERYVKEHHLESKKGLAFNGFDPEWYYLKHHKIVRSDYDQHHDKYDLHILDLAEKDFDFVMVNQTLEHLYDPIKCLINIYNHMKPGGILYFNVPSNNILHSTPFHYYTGFTPVGAGALVESAGFKILSIGQWGNLEYLKKLFETNKWPDYRQLQNPGVNEMIHPVIVWVFAIKEGADLSLNNQSK